jgi:hypothetical protein
MGEMRNAYKVTVVKPEANKHLRDLLVDGSIIWVLKKHGTAMWIGFIWLRTWTRDERGIS